MSDRKRRGGKNRLAEIQKPRGFDRGLEINEIVGATDYTGHLMYLIRWQNCDELDLLPASEVNDKCPQNVILFYEKRCRLNRQAKQRTQPNKPIIVKKVQAVTKPEPATEEETVESNGAGDKTDSAMDVDDAGEETSAATASAD